MATQGRAFWAIDDLSMVQQKGEELPNQSLKVFAVNDAYRADNDGINHNSRHKVVLHNAGANPAPGVIFNYYLKNVTDSSNVSITIFDKQHKEIKTFSSNAKEEANKLDFDAGLNKFAWNMLYPPGEKVDGLILWNGGVGQVEAAPGKYTARFRLEKDSVDVPFIINPNPNYDFTEADYDAKVAFLLQIRDKFNEIQKAIKDIREVRTQIGEFTSRMNSPATKQIKTFADTITRQLTAVEESLYQTKSKSGEDMLNFPIRLNDKLAGLYGVAASGENPPSKQAKETFEVLGSQSDVQLKKLNKIMSSDIPALNKMILDQQVPPIGIKSNDLIKSRIN